MGATCNSTCCWVWCCFKAELPLPSESALCPCACHWPSHPPGALSCNVGERCAPGRSLPSLSVIWESAKARPNFGDSVTFRFVMCSDSSLVPSPCKSHLTPLKAPQSLCPPRQANPRSALFCALGVEPGMLCYGATCPACLFLEGVTQLCRLAGTCEVPLPHSDSGSRVCTARLPFYFCLHGGHHAR